MFTSSPSNHSSHLLLATHTDNQLLPSNPPCLHLLKPLRDPLLQPAAHKSMSHGPNFPALQETSELLKILACYGIVGGRDGVVLEEEPERLGTVLAVI